MRSLARALAARFCSSLFVSALSRGRSEACGSGGWGSAASMGSGFSIGSGFSMGSGAGCGGREPARRA